MTNIILKKMLLNKAVNMPNKCEIKKIFKNKNKNK